MTRTVWIARHGNRQDFVNPDWPRTAKHPYDPGLSPDGIEQARRLGKRLASEPIAYIFASPFLRTVHTAHLAAEALQLPVYLEPGLSEWLNPEWFPVNPERIPVETLAAQFPRVDLSHHPSGFRPGYPETFEQAVDRAGKTSRHLAATYEGTLLLIGHGVSVFGAARGLVPEVEDFECGLCSLVKLVFREQQWIAELCGDVSHLDGGESADRYN